MNYKYIIDIIKEYRFKSIIFSNLKMLFFVFTIAAIIIFGIFFTMYSHSSSTKTNNDFIISAQKSHTNYIDIFKSLDNTKQNILRNNCVSRFLLSNDPFRYNLEATRQLDLLRQIMQSLLTEKNYIDSIHIYSNTNKFILSSSENMFLEDSPLIDNINDMLTTSQNPNLYLTEKDNSVYISVMYNIYDTSFEIPDGVLIFNIDTRKLGNHILSEYNTYEDFSIISKQGECIYTTADDDYSLSYTEYLPTDKEYTFKHNPSHMVCAFNSLPYNTYLVITAPTSLNRNILVGMVCLLLSVLLIFIISAGLALYSSQKLYTSISDVITYIELNETLFENNPNSTEMNFISGNLLKIIKKNSQIEQELIRKVIKLKRSQTIALQTQINPHFIFNTLNTINIMICKITKGNNTPAKIITLLSDILSYSLKTSNYIVSLSDELEYARKYIDLELLKNNNSFSVEFDIDESSKNCNVLKFSIQPLIENSINHGFKLFDGKRGELLISSWIENKILYLKIKDNGMGMPEDILLKLNSDLKTPDKIFEDKHIGIRNVNQRIKLVFGEKYGAYVDSNESGTTMILTFPTGEDYKNPFKF